MPSPAIPLLAEFKSPTSVQLLPFQDSHKATLAGTNPPKNKNAVLEAPAPDAIFLPVLLFKLEPSVQLEPSHDSEFGVGDPPVYPPTAIAESLAPSPTKAFLAVFKLLTSVHELPSHDSVLPVSAGAAVLPP